jgi:hypothetical protein
MGVWHNARPRLRSSTAPAAFIHPDLLTRVDAAPEGELWAHEIKHDGYRLQIHFGACGVRLYTMSGFGAEQIKQLTALTQRVTLTTAEPLKSGFFRGPRRVKLAHTEFKK